jgi:hypothetical protein
MFDALAPAERRRILLASRIRFTPEVRVPRQRALEKMIENALFVGMSGEWFTTADIFEAFKQIGGLTTLRLTETEECLSHLIAAKRVEGRTIDGQRQYILAATTLHEIGEDFYSASQLFERVLKTLYGDIHSDPSSLAPFFLEIVCDAFSILGAQWAAYLSGESMHALLELGSLEGLVERKVKKSDPDFDYLKFSMGQSFYVAKLLGIESTDYLSREIFADGILYLDSSVVIPALLGESRHHYVFQELKKVCARLGIRMCVTRLTVDEVRGVAADQLRIAPTVFDQVPASLTAQVRGETGES